MPVYLEVFVKVFATALTAVLTAIIITTTLSASLSSAQTTVENFGKPIQKEGSFPIKPDQSLTPGDLCDHADEIRYPERIKYCTRDVDGWTKRQIIEEYDYKLGYDVSQMNRQEFKIDHYIPLCAGGSNNTSNLWPQHQSVYTITDALEAKICEKMAVGRLKQINAIQIIKTGKNDLSKVPKLMQHLESL